MSSPCRVHSPFCWRLLWPPAPPSPPATLAVASRSISPPTTPIPCTRTPPAGKDMTDPRVGVLAQRRFREIVPPLLDDAYSLAKWLCRNAADAEDIVQEAAIRALKALETTVVDRPKPWFLMIVRNSAITW